MKVSEVGEFGLIDRVAETLSRPEARRPEGLLIGIGDDAAAWRCDGAVCLATSDALVQDVHFSLKTASWEDVGWKSLAVNLSDIAAMGGVPEYALVSLALPGDTDVEDVVRFYEGMADLANRFGVAVVGGDTVSSRAVGISVSVFGQAHAGGGLLTRTNARPGDVVAVTGSLGASAAGTEMLGKGLRFQAETADALRQACLRPWPRVTEGMSLVECGVRAAMDVSDGLLSDLNHICRASGVSARIDVDRIPVSKAVWVAFGERALGFALAGGEDFELLFTAPADTVAKAASALSCPVSVIGDVIGGPGRTELVDAAGKTVDLPGTGWDHFTAARTQP
jgi:thiamine-monophosphate kinase